MAPSSIAPGPARVRTERVFGGYLALQAVLGVVFWIVLASSPTVRRWLELDPQRAAVTNAFVFADGLAVVGSALGAWALWTNRRWAIVVVAMTLGAVAYPTIYLIGWVSFAGTGSGTGCLAVMVPVTVFTGYVTWQTWRLTR